jgi:hypothetical protein
VSGFKTPAPPGMSTLAQTSAPRSASVEVCFQPNRRGVGESLFGLQEGAVVKRTAAIRVISFVLLAACGLLCQQLPLADRFQELQVDRSTSPEAQRQEMRAAESLPDAPSTVQPPTHMERFFTFGNAAASPSTHGVLSIGVMQETKLGYFTLGAQPSSNAPYQVAFSDEESSAFLGKYLYPPLLEQDTHYYASTSDSFMGRASYAASRMFVTRDNSGKGRLNTSYFFGVLASVAIHVANRPYRARSTSETFNNFGSTIGGNAGINVFHEFRPGILQMVKGLTPKFVSRIEDRITHNQIPK